MIHQIFSSDQLEAAQRFMASGSRFVILTHISPDGDAMGSSLGMRHYLESVGKQATVIVPNAFPAFLSWLPGASEVLNFETNSAKVQEAFAQTDGIICTDFSEHKRIGLLGDTLCTFKQAHPEVPVLVIDHHLLPKDNQEGTTPKIQDILLSFPKSSSASELVYRLVGAPTIDGATCLYTGMMTDTVNFTVNSNQPEMFEIIADLVRCGVDRNAIYDKVFNQYSVDRMRLMGYCLYTKMQIFPEHHTALIYLSRKELYRFNFSSGDAEGLVNLPLQISDVYYSCFMREDKDKIKISFRSQGNRPVNHLASAVFHGGGHANASGGEHHGPLKEAVQLFLDNYPKYFKN